MNIEEVMEFIHKTSWQRCALGLSRIEELMRLLGNPEKKLKYVHIAGTNGKGSTAAFIASILMKAGYKTGLYTSPYINSFNERIQINGSNITNEELIKIAEEVKEKVKLMKEKPTEFEIITAMAFLYFRNSKVDIVVLEVGLGGRLDSTNIIEESEVAIITTIGLEHTKELGDTVEKIAYEKAGIIKKKCDTVLYQQSSSVHRIVSEICREKDSKLHVLNFNEVREFKSDLDSQIFNTRDYKNIEIKLLGEHQIKNAAVALKTAEVLKKRGWNISDDAIYQGLKKTKWPGRFEILNREPLFIVDGAHNPNGVASLVNNIEKYFPNKKVIILVGVMADKEYEKMFDKVAPFVKEFIVVQPNNPRALFSSDLVVFLKKRYDISVIDGGEVSKGVKEALMRAEASDIIIAFGSLYMVGDIRKFFIK